MAYLGEIRSFTSELPRDWLPCDGRVLSFDRHVALGTLLGRSYGGNDQGDTFALPDLRGRVVAGADPGRNQPAGATSGSKGAHEIPYAVARWGISVSGEYPFPVKG
jgi:microcystin-dependent protein